MPQTEITNGLVRARIYLPDAENGYYRGVRFDWSGVVASLTLNRHDFFGQWFAKYDPLLHDAITGPVEEFRSEDGALGYAAAPARGLFVKIGVGVLRKPDAEPYNFARSYTLVNPGKRVVRVESDHVDFLHELNDGEGYAYVYTKTLRLPHRKAELLLEHTLRNTGRRAIDTDVYNHDFFVMDRQPTGPATRVQFLFAPKVEDPLTAPAEIVGNEIRYTRDVREGESAFGALTGFAKGNEGHANDVRVENLQAGLGVRQTGDLPVSKLYFWSTRTTVCPEIYVHLHVDPGHTVRWRIRYEFYVLSRMKIG